ncbi:MAG: 23S rRNA (uracil(1939)-C(5))-methyltransferase RlmD [Anaerobiospirillum sp.]|nr:23S rRNA (uracil(1939)-C(5))-methyltransferase RlmD [Anaerobiospirillum sp.]
MTTVTITGRDRHGVGIAVHDGKQIYVPQALVGEVMEVEIGAPFTPKSARCPGTIKEILTPSPYRVDPQQHCAYAGRCGGCQLPHVSYEGQLAYKRDDIVAALSTVVGEQAEAFVRPLIPTSARPCRFKSIRYAASSSSARTPLRLGFYAPNSHDLVPVDACPLEPERFAQVAQGLEAILNELSIPSYDERKPQAETAVRALQLRGGDVNSVSAYLIMTGRLNKAQRTALEHSAQKLGLESLTVGYNNAPGNALFTRELELIVGAESITKTLLGARFAVYPNTFLQVNYEICTKLYEAAIAHCAQAQSHDLALDLCCGVGTMSLALAQHFEQVVGVEIVAESIAAAQANATANGLAQKCDFIAADMTKALPELIKRKRPNAIIADPARVGLGEANAKLLGKVPGPCRLAVIFCALTALKRDLPLLIKGGFKLDYVQGFDMFPGSQHVETLVCLTKA